MTKRRAPTEERHLRKALKQLTSDIRVCVQAFDKVSAEPQGKERGEKMAKIMNAIEMANDTARHFGLGEKL